MTPWHPILDIALDAAPLLRATGSIVHPGRIVLFGAAPFPEGASVTPHAVSWYDRGVHVRMVTTPTEEDITSEQLDALVALAQRMDREARGDWTLRASRTLHHVEIGAHHDLGRHLAQVAPRDAVYGRTAVTYWAAWPIHEGVEVVAFVTDPNILRSL